VQFLYRWGALGMRLTARAAARDFIYQWLVPPLTRLVRSQPFWRLAGNRDVTRDRSFTRLRPLLPAGFLEEGGDLLDVGANDGLMESESYGFRRAGFRILYVEPNPRLVPVLQRRVRGTQHIVYPHAIDTSRYRYSMYREHSAVTDTAVRVVPLGAGNPDPALYHEVKGETLETRRVDDLIAFMALHAFRPRVVKLDLEDEGVERRVMEELLRAGVLPELLIMESGDRDPSLAERLARLGYARVLESGYNRYYLGRRPSQSRPGEGQQGA